MKQPMTPETQDRVIALIDRSARAGDWRRLVLYLEDRGEVTEPLYDLLLAILRGQVKRRKGRLRDFAARTHHFRLSFEVWDLKREGLATEPAVAEVAAKYRVSQRAVYNAMKSCPGDILGRYRKLSSPAK